MSRFFQNLSQFSDYLVAQLRRSYAPVFCLNSHLDACCQDRSRQEKLQFYICVFQISDDLYNYTNTKIVCTECSIRVFSHLASLLLRSCNRSSGGEFFIIICQQLINDAHNQPVQPKEVIVGDETGVYGYDT